MLKFDLVVRHLRGEIQVRLRAGFHSGAGSSVSVSEMTIAQTSREERLGLEATLALLSFKRLAEVASMSWALPGAASESRTWTWS